MADPVPYTLIVDVPEQGVIGLTLQQADRTVANDRIAYQGHVDNVLLTAVDNLLKRNSIDRSALVSVTSGAGIDINSTLGRIVSSLSSAVATASASRRKGQK